MRKLSKLYKIELKIVLRQLDSIIFGIIFPAALSIILGFIFKDKPAYEGASYTFLEQSFGALAVIGVCATGLVGIPMNLSNDRHLKILKRFRVTPVSPGLLLSVQAAVQLSIAFLSLAIVYLVLHFGFGYKMAGSFASKACGHINGFQGNSYNLGLTGFHRILMEKICCE